MTDTVTLRPVSEPDLGLLALPHTDRETAGPFAWFGPGDPDELARRFAQDRFLGEHDGRLVVDVGDTPAGTVSWRAVPHGPVLPTPCWHIGIWLHPDHRGHGVGTAAQRLVTLHLFEHTDAQRVEAGTDADNLAERTSRRRAGFRFAGILRGAQHRDGAWRDIAMYARLRSDS